MARLCSTVHRPTSNITATFDFDPTYTGIDGVDADAQSDSNTVYTIEQRRMRCHRRSRRITQRLLAPGFYIINGKKTFVKIIRFTR